MGFQLQYGPLVDGEITEVYEDQGTWYGTFHPALSTIRGPLESRIGEFIAFCEDFNARCEAGKDPGAAAFDPFDDLLSSRSWRVRDPRGAISEIREARISWVTEGFAGSPSDEALPEAPNRTINPLETDMWIRRDAS
jgi:hypothetical protein